jgi:hypothetical protein
MADERMTMMMGRTSVSTNNAAKRQVDHRDCRDGIAVVFEQRLLVIRHDG